MRKECKKCSTVKPLSEFQKEKSKWDGYNSICKACKTTYKKRWNHENKKNKAEYQRRWEHENKDKIKCYWAKNKDKVRAKNQRAKHKRRAAKHIPYDFRQVWEEWQGRCVVCLEPISFADSTVEHLVAISKLGPDTAANVGPSHSKCNLRMGAKIKDVRPRGLQRIPCESKLEVGALLPV